MKRLMVLVLAGLFSLISVSAMAAGWKTVEWTDETGFTHMEIFDLDEPLRTPTPELLSAIEAGERMVRGDKTFRVVEETSGKIIVEEVGGTDRYELIKQ